MTTTELNRAVARRTGETPDRIARHGFQIVGPPRPPVELDPEAYCVDWDAVSYGDDVFPPTSKRPAV